MTPSELQRLHALRHANEERGAVLDGLRPRFAELAGRHENGTAPRAVAAFNLFQTPPEIAARMAGLVAEHLGAAGGRVLEPSAGLGRIYRALQTACPAARVVLVEEAADCARELYRLTEGNEGDRLYQRDFLEVQDAHELGGTFDAVCMNPPFKQGEDMRHIRHARAMLRPGGLLVALCYDGARQNASLRPECTTWEVLPAGSFLEAGTRAGVVLATIWAGQATGGRQP